MKNSMDMEDENLTPQQRFQNELAPISFQELQKFFAKGMMIVVSQQLDMVDVAMKIHEDDVSVIQQWMDNEQLVRAHDEHAKQWVSESAELMAVTVAPWVLVQELKSEVLS